MSAEQIPQGAPEFLLIDLSSIAYPVWHMSSAEPDPNATSIKTVARVRALAASHPRAAICADSGRSFRSEIDPTYKANRPESDATLQHQIGLAIETLRADGFPVWAVKGYEADDLIATAATKALEIPGATVLVASADKDLLALVGPRVGAKSLKDGSVLDEAAVIAKFGVKPCQMRDYLTLVGDSSDNIKGAKGIGPKKAAELLHTFVELDIAYQCIDDKTGTFSPSTVAALEELRPRLATVRALVTMKTDAPIQFEEILADRVPQHADFVPMEEVMDEPEITLVDPSAPLTPMPEAKPSPVVSIARTDQPAPPVDWERALEPRSMRDAMALAENLHASRLFSAYGSAQGVLATVLAGREFGIQAVASLRAFHIIENKPTLAADTIRALVLRSGKAKYFRCIERTAERATFETQRGDDPPVQLSYTIEEGKVAWPKKDPASMDWLKSFMASGWGRNPADMCVARAGTKLARLVYPDVIHGLYATEEIDA